MRDLHYHLLDVFTDTPFGGNQLAVFPDADDLPAATMQLIARELNLAETVFVQPPQNPQNHVRLRIFTPVLEMPFAGHPTVGAAHLLHHLGRIPDAARFEENVGLIEMTLTKETGGTVRATMRQPTPQSGSVFEDRVTLAQILSLDSDDLLPNLPAQVVSSGVPFLFVPIRSLAAIRRIHINGYLIEKHLIPFGAANLYTFTLETERPGSTTHSRMFAPELGIVEDPATGAASGPLGAYLLRHGLVSAEQAQHMINEQGFEIKRPSLIYIEVSGGEPLQVKIGGFSQIIGAGTLHLPE